MDYQDKALNFAERHGIITYQLEGNTMIYFERFPVEGVTYKATVNLDTMQEDRIVLPI